MPRPRTNEAVRLIVVLLICTGTFIPGASARVYAQQLSDPVAEDTARGIQLYQQGDTKGAIKALRAAVKKNRDDVAAWDYLALALTRDGQEKEARTARMRAAERRQELFDKEFDAVSDHLTEASVLRLKAMYQEASDGIRMRISAGGVTDETDYLNAVLDNMEAQGEFLDRAGEAWAQGKVLRWSDVPKTRARILSKPNPIYTQEAQRNRISGTILLKVILAADGRVKALRTVKGLSDGLTEEAVQAARNIKFQPATINGRSVSQIVTVEYSFDVH